jgi:N-acetylmuramoyl-L-alanine amidase
MKWFLTCCLCGLGLTVPGQTHEEQAVAAVLMGEAWSEGARGMTAVAEVIHQRAIEKGRTPLQIVTARRRRVHAFSCLNGATLDRLIHQFRQEPDYQHALQLAQTVCQTPDRLPGLTLGANHFTRATERPYWAKGKRPVVVIGRHAFYRLKHY